MTAVRFVAYYRVSTARQGRSGLGLDAQRDAVRGHASGVAQLLAEYTEIESGRRNDRPELAKALAACRLHRATLVIAKLDRLARNVTFISALMDSGVEFVAADMPAASRLTVHMLAAVAEHEARMISERTKAALAAAKRRGIKLGGFRGRAASDADRLLASLARAQLADARARDLADTIGNLRSEGIVSLRAIARRLTQLGIATTGSYDKLGKPTGHGGAWTGVQVRRIIARLDRHALQSS
ncbi:MAG: resolvase [Alphaproteobacteria bacterium 65-37]|jgi:DNA invertase Pin-like site-specific DNA recombinase|nr:recombinase family protein [Alphaproteobacteria bacterium]OJU33972.1 MAG: resolvase [Alphaproteobacteria bacterium 65-37]